MRYASIAAVVVTLCGACVQAAVAVYGGMTADMAAYTGHPARTTGVSYYDGSTWGLLTKVTGINSAGQAYVKSYQYDGYTWGPLASDRWSPAGYQTLLSIDSVNANVREACAINSSGTVAGYSYRPLSGGVYQGTTAVRWTGTSPAPLSDAFPGTSGAWANGARAINDAGQTAGFCGRLDMAQGRITLMAPCRWDADGTAHELAHLGTSSGTQDYGRAMAINNTGVAAGFVPKYVSGTSKGTRAVRWDASGAVHELANLGTDSTGFTEGLATLINSSGQVAGIQRKYVGGVSQGYRAVRWESSGVALELSDQGHGNSQVAGMNDAGNVVGCVGSYVFRGTDYHAVIWGNDGSAELLGTLAGYSDTSIALDINEQGQIVGQSGGRAVLWGTDHIAVDLNALIAPDLGWTLTEADAITDNGWVSGVGMYDADGAGPAVAYSRAFSIQVPEPVSMVFAIVAGSMLLVRRRRAKQALA